MKTISNNCNYTHKVQANSTCKFGAHDKRLACPGVDIYSGKKWETTTERFARNSSLSEGAVYGQGQNGHFHWVKILWTWHQQNGLDETKTWALESPDSELRVKRYDCLTTRDLFVEVFLQTSPWVLNVRIFLPVVPNQVIPKPTSLFRRARSVDVMFIIFSPSEIDHFALSHKQPPLRENCFQQIFPRSFHTSSRSICRPLGNPTSYHEPRTCMLTLLTPCVCVVTIAIYRFYL